MPDPITQWHAVVLGRILPGCQSNRALSTYRSNVPLSIMLQQSLVNCKGYQETLYNINKAFSLRSPISNHQATALVPYPQDTQHLFNFNNHRIIYYTLESKSCASDILNNFDKNNLVLTKEPNRWVLSVRDPSMELIINMFQLIYRTPVCCLQFKSYPTAMQDTSASSTFNLGIN